MTNDPDTKNVVLVVDDDPVMRRLVVGGLARIPGLRVLEAEDGESAQRELEATRCDLVITDLMMPGIDGIDLLRWAREHHQGPDWIVLSGVEDFDVAVEALHCGAFDFIKKPPHIKELEVTVQNVLERRHLVEERESLLDELRRSSIEMLDRMGDLERQSERIQRDLQKAQVIQRALMPSELPTFEGLQIHAIYRPAETVGGDMYDVAKVSDHELVIYVADAMGHGVASAMMSVLFKQRLTLRDHTGSCFSPAEALRLVNQRLVDDRPADGMFVTVVMMRIDMRSSKVRIASAGHTPVLVSRASGDVEVVDRTGPALGISREVEYVEHELSLERGDRVLLHTDGLNRACDDSADVRDLHERIAADLREADGPAVLLQLFEEATSCAADGSSDRDIDDVTMVLLEMEPGESTLDNGCDRKSEADERPTPSKKSILWLAVDAEHSHLSVRGRGSWVQSEEFHRHACAAIDAGRRLTIDLSQCEHLDSACLGTLHEVVVRDPARVVVAAPSEPLIEAFEELGLDAVTGRIDRAPVDPPSEPVPLRADRPAARETQVRLLRAHETLASMSPANRERFQDLVDALRAELEL